MRVEHRLWAWALPSAALVVSAGIGVAAGCATESRDGFTGSAPEPSGTFQPKECPVKTCTADMQSVVDCEGKPTLCGEGLGCVDGACVPACDAAKKLESTIGCEYYSVLPSTPASIAGSCYAVLLANVWNSPVELEIEWGDQKLSSSYIRIPRGSGANVAYDLLTDGKLPPGKIGIAFLSAQPPAGANQVGGPTWQGLDCPASVGAAIRGPTGVTNSGRGKAFHITSSAPIVAYDIYPYGGAKSYFPSSSLLLPTSAWGTNYVAVDGYSVSGELAAGGVFPYFQVLAAEDDTTVDLLPTTTLASGPGLPGAEALAPYQAKLSRGEFLQFVQKDEINGTIVDANRKVTVFGGNQCAFIPEGLFACDTLHQQLPPVQLMGNSYVATRYRDRLGDNQSNREVVPWRILGVVDGTVLSYDPPIAAAPKTIERGVVSEFLAPGPFVVSSQDIEHPIHVLSYMTAGDKAFTATGTCVTCKLGLGDPEFVNVVPRDQYLSNYVFLTDPTFGNTNLVFVRNAKEGKDVHLDCLGAVAGWQKVGSSDYEMARVDLMFRGQPVGDCENGIHRASSEAPFGLTVWGFDNYASYGYPAGMAAKPLNKVVVPVVR